MDISDDFIILPGKPDIRIEIMPVPPEPYNEPVHCIKFDLSRRCRGGR